jgi:hypothetical protein
MTEPRTLWAARLQWIGLSLFFVGVLAIFIGALAWLSGCATVEKDAAIVARDVQPVLTDGCVFVEAVDATNPWVDFICTSSEAVDRILQALPDARVLGTASIVVPDGGRLPTQVVRVPTPIRLPTAPDSGTP